VKINPKGQITLVDVRVWVRKSKYFRHNKMNFLTGTQLKYQI